MNTRYKGLIKITWNCQLQHLKKYFSLHLGLEKPKYLQSFIILSQSDDEFLKNSKYITDQNFLDINFLQSGNLLSSQIYFILNSHVYQRWLKWKWHEIKLVTKGNLWRLRVPWRLLKPLRGPQVPMGNSGTVRDTAEQFEYEFFYSEIPFSFRNI